MTILTAIFGGIILFIAFNLVLYFIEERRYKTWIKNYETIEAYVPKWIVPVEFLRQSSIIPEINEPQTPLRDGTVNQ